MRAASLVLLVLVVNVTHAARPKPCEAILAGGPAPATVRLVFDHEKWMNRIPERVRDTAGLSPEAASRLPELLHHQPYFGPATAEPMTIALFDVRSESRTDVAVPVRVVHLGASLRRGREEFTIRTSLPVFELDKGRSIAFAIALLVNHFDVLKSPVTLDREIGALKMNLRRLAEGTGVISRDLVEAARLRLDEAPTRTSVWPWRRAAELLGERFAANHVARQMLTHAWTEKPAGQRQSSVDQILKRNKTRDRNSGVISEVVVRGRYLLERAWFTGVNHVPGDALAVWFEALANGDGSVFVKQGLAKAEEPPSVPPTAQGAAAEDEDRTSAAPSTPVAPVSADQGNATGVPSTRDTIVDGQDPSQPPQ